MTDKDRLRKAFEHGKSVATYLVGGLPERYAPLTFDSWYEESQEELILPVVSHQRELLKAFQEYYQSDNMDDEKTFDWNIDEFLEAFNCG